MGLRGSSGSDAARAVGIALFAALVAVLAWASARMATLMVECGGISVAGLQSALPRMREAFTQQPFAIAWDLAEVRIAVAIAVVAPLLFMLSYVTRGMRLNNEDTQEAHGNARFATDRERGELLDRRHHYNNLWYSEHCGMVLDGYDRRTKAAQQGLNLNCVTLGISGLGKTFNLVKYDLMQSVGNALEPAPYGVRNVPLRLLRAGGGGVPNEGGGVPSRLRKPALPSWVKVPPGEGFDVVNTDPKGDNVRDCGWMFEAAGFEVKVVDTITFRGLRVNPLANIEERWVDLKERSLVEVGVESEVVACNGVAEAISLPGPLRDGREEVVRREMHKVSARMSLETDVRQGVGAPEAGFSVEGGACPKVSEALGEYSYRVTSGEVEVDVESFLVSEPALVSVRIRLDPALEVDESLVSSGRVEYLPDGSVEWVLAGDGSSFCECVQSLLLRVHIRPMQVADGVGLTKTVDCLVANLKGTDAASNGSEDPFWEDTKRLCFMALVAFLFERYPAEQRTIPQMMKLLDMALSPDGDAEAVSPLDVLMEQWEHARIFEEGDEVAEAGVRGARRGGRWVATDNDPHDRTASMALHCYYAFKSGAADTVRSIVISCQAALANLVSPEVKEFLSRDELHLETLGDPGQKQVIFLVTKDTDSPFDFITALILYQAIDLAQDKAFSRYGGRLPRHVRFVLDEVANVGRIPILIRALAVVRSRNISISLFVQSKAQLAVVYGEKQTDIIFDNCSTIIYLGAQSESTLEEMSKMLGEETVFSRTFQRNFGESGAISASNESIQATSRRLRSTAELRRLTRGKLLVFVFNHYPVYDGKNQTWKHPLYRHIDPGSQRGWLQPPALHSERFDYDDYLRRRGLRG